MNNKICNKCSIDKPVNEYKTDARNKDGLQGICKECTKKWQQERRALRRKGIGIVAKTEKCCNRCEITKKVEDFYRDSGTSDGFSTLCKVCRNVSMDNWRNNNRAKYNENMRVMRATERDRFKDIDLRRTYGISLLDYIAMLNEQDGKCLHCGKQPGGTRPLVVDHDHATDMIRGLLCYKCNRDMAIVDNDEMLAKQIQYRDKYRLKAKKEAA